MTKKFLRNLNGSDPESIARAFKIVNADGRMDNAPLDGDDDDDDTGLLDTGDTLTDVERVRLASFELWADKRLQGLIDQLTTKISDINTATAAVTGFDIKWFQQLPFSNEGKQKIAATLIRLTDQYNTLGNTFWESLVDGNSDALNAVSFNIANLTGIERDRALASIAGVLEDTPRTNQARK